MIDASLQYGPFDGYGGQVPDDIPLALDVRRCPTGECRCGRPLHYLRVPPGAVTRDGFVRYELVAADDMRAVYRHADTLDPSEARMLWETLSV